MTPTSLPHRRHSGSPGLKNTRHPSRKPGIRDRKMAAGYRKPGAGYRNLASESGLAGQKTERNKQISVQNHRISVQEPVFSVRGVCFCSMCVRGSVCVLGDRVVVTSNVSIGPGARPRQNP